MLRMKLIYKYPHEDKSVEYEQFWLDKSGDFDREDGVHVAYMITYVKDELGLDDYGVKRLEVTIKTELPFFACKRLIAKKWLVENFNM